MQQQPNRFLQTIGEMLRGGAADEHGLYHYAAPVEDMFITMGIGIGFNPANAEPETIAAVNALKFRHVGILQTILRRYSEGDYDGHIRRAAMRQAVHRNEQNLNRFDLVALDRAVFHDLVASYEMNYHSSGRVLMKLVHYLDTMYNNEAFFQQLAGRYPFKIIISLDTVLSIPRLINNAMELKALLISALFRLIGQADFYNAQNGGGIDYGQVGDLDGDQDIDEDEHGNPIREQLDAPVIDNFRGQTISMLVIQYSRLMQGRQMPSQLRLPENLARSVINPNNNDSFCLIWCLLIASKIMANPTEYSKIKNKTSLNKIENFPVLQQAFDDLFDDFIELYDEDDYVRITPENLEELERIFGININIYQMVNDSSKRADIVYRSTFTTVQTEEVARLLYVPYTTMLPFKEKSNVTKFNLGSKTTEEFKDELNNETFFDLNDGHFVLLPTNSSLITGEKASDNYYCCSFCDTRYRGEATFQEHKKNCRRFQVSKDAIATRMLPNPKGASTRFTNYHTLSKCPFVIYGDTETQTDEDGHRLFSYFLYAKHESDSTKDLYLDGDAKRDSQVGDGMIRKFMEHLTVLRIHLRDNTNLFPFMDQDEYNEFTAENKKKTCLFCGCVPINKKTGLPDSNCLVTHHDHNKPSPNIVGYLCQSCNIKEAKVNNSFPVVFHNLPYDLLVLIKILTVKNFKLAFEDGISMCSLTNNASVLAKTSMKYAAMTISREKMICQREDLSIFKVDLPELRFIDSCAFVQDSLENIVKELKGQSKDHKKTFATTWEYLQDEYPEIAEELFACSTEKGVIAYSHTSCGNMLSKTNLPMSSYTNNLDLTQEYLEKIEEENPELAERLEEAAKDRNKSLQQDYDHSNKIFAILKKKFGERMTYGHYFRFYGALDVLLLADFFTWFRKTLTATHEIDPAWYLGLPSYSQNCMLHMTGNVLHFIERNLEVSRLITENLRGGLSVIINKTAENLEQNPAKHIAGIDINNLYGKIMQEFKIANKFLGEIDLDTFERDKVDYSLTGDYAYFLLVDYDASAKKLQDLVSQLPPLVSSKNIDFSMLSAEQASQKDANYRSEKLCCTLENGTNYLINFDNLLFFRRLGYKFYPLRVFKFKKEYLFRDYILKNSGLRQASKSEFAKTLYKLLNNIIYGKSLQRNDLHSQIEILSDRKLIHKRLINPRLKRVDIIKNNELVMTNTTPSTAKFDTCIQAGFHILELSKLWIYSLIYEKILPFCRQNQVGYKFLLSDTDSLYLQYDFAKSKFADYAEYTIAISAATGIFDNHAWNNPAIRDMSKKKQVGLFLDEEADNIEILGYVGLCSKSYCLLFKALRDVPGHKAGEVWCKIKGKGVPSRYLKALYQYQDYKDCVLGNMTESRKRVEFQNIQRSGYHNVTTTVNKLALSSFNDKMFCYIEDGVWKSLPHGHYKIPEIRGKNEEAAE